MNDRFTILFVNGPGERNIHRAGFHTILSVSAIRNAIVTHNCFEPFITGQLSCGMHVEESNLSYSLWPDVMLVFILWAGFETTATSHAARIGIAFLDVLLIHAGTGSQIVCTVQFDPGVNASEMVEHPRTIDDEIANIWKLGHRLESNWLLELIDER